MTSQQAIESNTSSVTEAERQPLGSPRPGELTEDELRKVPMKPATYRRQNDHSYPISGLDSLSRSLFMFRVQLSSTCPETCLLHFSLYEYVRAARG